MSRYRAISLLMLGVACGAWAASAQSPNAPVALTQSPTASVSTASLSSSASPTDEIASLQRRLRDDDAEIQTLRASAAASAAATAAQQACTEKNVRLVGIGREILAAYDRRYHHGLRDPLQLTRARFETEAQDYADRIYDNQYDAKPRKEPGKSKKDKAKAAASAQPQ